MNLLFACIQTNETGVLIAFIFKKASIRSKKGLILRLCRIEAILYFSYLGQAIIRFG